MADEDRGVSASPTAAMPTFEPDGTVNVPAFQLPPSALSSAAARFAQQMRARMPLPVSREQDPDIVAARAQVDGFVMPRALEMRARYPVDVVEDMVGGVPVRVLTPAAGDAVPDVVLINLHGGAFSVGWDSCSLVESIPLAGLGKFRVVSVNYRMAPEHRHPAAVEDAAAVYAALLARYPASRIGVFGCSAGGNLTAQLAAWLPARGLPQMGAAGIFGAGGARFATGDSANVTGYIDGAFPAPSPDGSRADITRGYFDGTDMDDPIVSPALHPEVIARFPPSLVITGTRAMDLSPAIITNNALLKAGVRATLIVGEAMGHCYIYQDGLPETQDAFAVMIAFFRENLR